MSTDKITAVSKVNYNDFTKTKDHEQLNTKNNTNLLNNTARLKSVIIEEGQKNRTIVTPTVDLNLPSLGFVKVDTSFTGSMTELQSIINKLSLEASENSQNLNADRIEEKLYSTIYKYAQAYFENNSESENLNNDVDQTTANGKVYVYSTTNHQTTAYMLLIMLPLAKAMAESNFAQVDEQLAINNSVGEILRSSANAAENYTDQIIEETKKAQEKLDKLLHKFSGFIGIAVGALEIAMAIYTGIKSVAVGNFAGAAASAVIFVDGAMRFTAGTLVILDTYTKCFGGDLANDKNLQDMCLYGVFSLMGGDAAKIQMATMAAVMVVSLSVELSALTETIYGLANTAARITAEIVKQLAMMLISAASSAVGLVFAFKAMVESYTDKQQKDSLDPEQVTAMFGGRMGLLALVIDKSGLRDLITEGLAKELSEENAEMVETIFETGLYIGLSMGNMYGNSVNQKNLSTLISENEVTSMITKLQGKLPQSVLVQADNILTKMHQMINKSSALMNQSALVAAFSAVSTYVTSNSIASAGNSVGMTFFNKILQDVSIDQREKSQLLEVLNDYNKSRVDSLQSLSANIGKAINSDIGIQKQMYDNLTSLALQG